VSPSTTEVIQPLANVTLPEIVTLAALTIASAASV
jgi:hypothetical protein